MATLLNLAMPKLEKKIGNTLWMYLWRVHKRAHDESRLGVWALEQPDWHTAEIRELAQRYTDEWEASR